MRVKTIRIFIISIVSAMISLLWISCDGRHPGQNAHGRDILFKRNGEVIHKYNSSNWQMSYNDYEKKFSVFIDDGTEYYTLLCKEMPQKEGQIFFGVVNWTQNHMEREKKCDFKVLEIGQDGLIRLEATTGDIYLTVKQLYE